MSSRRSKRSAASNTQEDVTVGAPSVKKGKGRGKRSTRGTAGVGSELVSEDCQTDFLTRDDIPTIVQVVCDALPQRNSSNAVAPTSGMPGSQGVDSLPMQQSTNANQCQEDSFKFRRKPLPVLTPCPATSTELDIAYLQQMAQVYYDRGLAPNTKSTYSAGQQRLISFCKSSRLLSMLASESTLLLFATHLANSYATIKIYLLAVRHMHVTAGMHNFFTQQLTP